MPVARFLNIERRVEGPQTTQIDDMALGSAILIRMAKLGCGALASGFIASHHAC